MRKPSIIFSLAVAALAISAAIMQESTEAQNGATVLNHSDGLACFFGAAGGSYSGPATLVETPSGNVNGQCNAELTAGTAVAQRTRVTLNFTSPFGIVEGTITLTPSGNGNASFHRK